MEVLLWERVALAVVAVMRTRQVVAVMALSVVVMGARQGLVTVVGGAPAGGVHAGGGGGPPGGRGRGRGRGIAKPAAKPAAKGKAKGKAKAKVKA